jgi:hypothetical protein
MTKGHVQRWIGLLSLGTCLVFAPQIARADTSRPAGPAELAQQVKRPMPDSGVPVDGNFQKLGYAEREAQQHQTADFKGGEGVAVYIGGSALAVVLFVVLLVVLL